MPAYVYRGATRDLGVDLEDANAAIMAGRARGVAMPEAGFEWPAQRRARLAAENLCGTDAGYKRHQKHHQGPCDACRHAHNAANRGRQARKQATS